VSVKPFDDADQPPHEEEEPPIALSNEGAEAEARRDPARGWRGGVTASAHMPSTERTVVRGTKGGWRCTCTRGRRRGDGVEVVHGAFRADRLGVGDGGGVSSREVGRIQ
jgi:hypothetical protein